MTQLVLQGFALFLQVFNVVLLAQDEIGRQSLTSNEQAGQEGETSYLEGPLVGPSVRRQNIEIENMMDTLLLCYKSDGWDFSYNSAITVININVYVAKKKDLNQLLDHTKSRLLYDGNIIFTTKVMTLLGRHRNLSRF